MAKKRASSQEQKVRVLLENRAGPVEISVPDGILFCSAVKAIGKSIGSLSFSEQMELLEFLRMSGPALIRKFLQNNRDALKDLEEYAEWANDSMQKGPRARQKRPERRRPLIAQALDLKITSPQAVFDHIKNIDPDCLLAHAKTGRLISPESMMRDFRRANHSADNCSNPGQLQ